MSYNQTSMCLDPHLEIGWGLGHETSLGPPVNYFYWPYQGGTSFWDHMCCLWLVFVMLSCPFIGALGHLLGKGWPSWLEFVMFVFLSLSHVVSWVRCGTCGTWLYRFLIFTTFLTLFLASSVVFRMEQTSCGVVTNVFGIAKGYVH